MGTTHSVNEIAPRSVSSPCAPDLARKEGRPDDAAEIERRIDGYRGELAERP